MSSQFISRLLHDMPIAEMYAPYPIFILLRFHRWDEVLKLPPPNPSLAMTNGVLAFRLRSRVCHKEPDRDGEAERKTLQTAYRDAPADLEFSMFSNKARTFLELAANILDARIAAAKGEHEQAIKYWEEAVKIEDGLY